MRAIAAYASMEIPQLGANVILLYFIKKFNHQYNKQVRLVDPAVLSFFSTYSWPGNIRELYHVIEYAFAVGKGNILRKQHLPEKITKKPVADTKHEKPVQSEKEMILRALEQTNFRKGKAAALLGISPNTLYRKRKKYNL